MRAQPRPWITGSAGSSPGEPARESAYEPDAAAVAGQAPIVDVPADFVAFVAAHESGVTRALAALTGNDHLAGALRRDLFAAVALRWRWYGLRPGGRRAGAAYLYRLLRREQRDWARDGRIDPGHTKRRLPGAQRWDRSPPPDPQRPAPRPSGAERAWSRARVMRRNRRMITFGTIAAVALLWAVGPRTTPSEAVPPEGFDVPVPAGVTVLPPFTHLPGLDTIETDLPDQIHIDLTRAPDLRGDPIPRASALLRPDLGPLVLVADDGTTRVLNDAELLGAKALTSSLSPDGTKAALPSADGVLVLDVATGALRSIALPAARLGAAMLAWRDPQTVIVAGIDGAIEINVDSGDTMALPGLDGADVLTGTAGEDGLVELRGPAAENDRSHLRVWSDAAQRPAARAGARSVLAGNFVDHPVDGPPWLASWSGPGWISDVIAVRNCSARDIPLPRYVGRPRSAVAAITRPGSYTATLVTVDTTLIEPLGFSDPRRVLVAVHAPQTATMVLAWYPHTAQLRRVTSIDAYAVVSLPSAQPA